MRSSPSAWAVIVAAGTGLRFGSSLAKQFAPLAGKPVVIWSVEAFRAHPDVQGVTLVLPEETLREPPHWLRSLLAERVVAVAGGPERTDSVRLGLATVPPGIAIVAVHDGVRPLVSGATISRVLAVAARGCAAVAGRHATDSLKEVDSAGRVVRSLDRTRVWQAETPQAFPRDLIVEMHRLAERDGVHETDCAGLCQRYGAEVVMVELTAPNPKVTRPEDLEWLESWLTRRRGAGSAESGEGEDEGERA
jgi:2-C-methyl-D-erythritol 4-phosphate cytidylyltransferase